MDQNGIEAFGAQFNRPGWLIATFILPLLFTYLIRFLVDLIRQRLDLVSANNHSLSPVGLTAPAPGNLMPEYNAPKLSVLNYTSLLLKAAAYTRPLFILFLGLYVFLLTGSFVLVRKMPGAAALFYLGYFMAALLYHIGEFRKDFNKPVGKITGKLGWLKVIVIPVTYAHIPAFLYMLVHESFFGLLAFSSLHHKLDSFFLSLFLLIFPVAGILVIKDLLYPQSNLISRLLALILFCCVITFLFLFVNLRNLTA
jgi:hypothetical protein